MNVVVDVTLAVSNGKNIQRFCKIKFRVGPTTTFADIAHVLETKNYADSVMDAQRESCAVTLSDKVLMADGKALGVLTMRGVVHSTDDKVLHIQEANGHTTEVQVTPRTTVGTFRMMASDLLGTNLNCLYFTINGNPLIESDNSKIDDALKGNNVLGRRVINAYVVNPLITLTLCHITLKPKTIHSTKIFHVTRTECIQDTLNHLLLERTSAIRVNSRATLNELVVNATDLNSLRVEYVVLPPLKQDEDICVFVKTLTGKTISIYLNSLASVNEVKNHIERIEGVPSVQQRLIFGGVQLEAYGTLESYGVHNDNTLHLVLGLRGGMFIDVNERVVFDLVGEDSIGEDSIGEVFDVSAKEEGPDEKKFCMEGNI